MSYQNFGKSVQLCYTLVIAIFRQIILDFYKINKISVEKLTNGRRKSPRRIRARKILAFLSIRCGVTPVSKPWTLLGDGQFRLKK